MSAGSEGGTRDEWDMWVMRLWVSPGCNWLDGTAVILGESNCSKLDCVGLAGS